MITIASLVILLFTSDGPAYISKAFDNHFNCQQAEVLILDEAASNKKVTGFTVLVDCPLVSEDIKT